MARRNLISGLALGAAALGMVILGGSTAGAATPAVSVSLVGVGLTSPPTSGTLNFADWSVTGVAVGTSPLVGTASIEYSYEKPNFDQMSFTLSGPGGTITGGGANVASSDAQGANTLVGSISSATGAYAGLVGHTVTITIDISPKLVLGIEQSLGTTGAILNGLLSESVNPSVLLGSLTIS